LISEYENILSQTLNKIDQEKLDRTMSLLTKSTGTGIGYHVDTLLKTDRTVFAIVGINNNAHGYGKYVWVLDSSLLDLPSTWVNPCAATFFQSGRSGELCGRSWLKPLRTLQCAMTPESTESFERSKYRNSVPGALAITLASDLVARIAFNSGGQITLDTITPEMVREYMETMDSHNLPEVHLAPFSMQNVVKLFIPEAMATSYPQHVEQLKKTFGDKLVFSTSAKQEDAKEFSDPSRK
jgi:hypothetical protein